MAQIARDFRVSDATFHEWLKKGDIGDGVREGVTEAGNSDIESLHALSQKNDLITRRWETTDELQLAIVT